MDGQTLYAGGVYPFVVSWGQGGHGKRLSDPACGVDADPVTGLVPLPERKLVVATQNPCLSVLDADWHTTWIHPSPKADFRNQYSRFAASTDGAVVDFGFEMFGNSPLRFNVGRLNLSVDHDADGMTHPARLDGIAVTDWLDSYRPKINGRAIALQMFEFSRSLAIDPRAQYFVLGTIWSLREIAADGKPLWQREVPGEVWAVNISGDGRLVIAAYQDGTIRWYRSDDGRELLALQVLSDKKNWVLWTPEGFYAATPGAHGVLRWLVNHGPDKAAATVPVSAIAKLNRPDALPLILQERETARALGIADLAAARIDVQRATGAAEAPGARLYVLTVGISDYGENAKALRLNFADKDAEDVANALNNTQGGKPNKTGLYADIDAQYLANGEATEVNIINALNTMERIMAANPPGPDLAVVMFSGHGAMIDGQFYLLPYGINTRTMAEIEAAAIPVSRFQSKIGKLAKYGRVLVLLDACHSGAVAEDGTNFAPDADLLRAAMVGANISVLTSSSATEVSREKTDWENGAFTKVLKEALRKPADENNDGMISMSELASYISRHLPDLTGGKQHPGMKQQFEGNLFVAGL